jgi:hypothetical protein
VDRRTGFDDVERRGLLSLPELELPRLGLLARSYGRIAVRCDENTQCVCVCVCVCVVQAACGPGAARRADRPGAHARPVGVRIAEPTPHAIRTAGLRAHSHTDGLVSGLKAGEFRSTRENPFFWDVTPSCSVYMYQTARV